MAQAFIIYNYMSARCWHYSSDVSLLVHTLLLATRDGTTCTMAGMEVMSGNIVEKKKVYSAKDLVLNLS